MTGLELEPTPAADRRPTCSARSSRPCWPRAPAPATSRCCWTPSSSSRARTARSSFLLVPDAGGVERAAGAPGPVARWRRDDGPHGRARRLGRRPATCSCPLGLGSCIGLALVDRRRGVAGLAHVVLPEPRRHASAEPAQVRRPRRARRSSTASSRSARRAPLLEAVLVGGAQHVRRSARQRSRSAPRNEAAVRAALARRADPVVAAATGGDARAARSASTSAPATRRPSREAGGAEPSCSAPARGGSGMSGDRSSAADADRRARRRGPRGRAARGDAPRRSARRARCARSTSAPDEVHRRPGAAARAARSNVLPHRVDAPVGRAARAARARGHRRRASSRGPTRTRRCPRLDLPRSSTSSRSARACCSRRAAARARRDRALLGGRPTAAHASAA